MQGNRCRQDSNVDRTPTPMHVTERAIRQDPATFARSTRRKLRLDGHEDVGRTLRRIHEKKCFDIRIRREPTERLLALLQEFLVELVDRRRMPRLSVFARATDIDVEHVRILILRLLSSYEASIEGGSCPVRLYTLGNFEVRTRGEALRFEGKAQRKPMALAKVLVALGGREIPAGKLIDILWPEPSEGDGQKAFDITVHRLRKLLGSDEAVQVADRRATLNPQVVWVDAWALEHTLAPLIAAVNAAEPPIEMLEAAATKVLNLYRGHFLAGESEEAWQIPMKNRLAGRFQRFVLRLGEHWESQQQWRRAFELYQRAVDLDPLAESFYRRQMICLHAQGLRAEAIEVFRRCRQALSVMLGVAPTGDTDAVYRQLLAS